MIGKYSMIEYAMPVHRKFEVPDQEPDSKIIVHETNRYINHVKGNCGAGRTYIYEYDEHGQMIYAKNDYCIERYKYDPNHPDRVIFFEKIVKDDNTGEYLNSYEHGSTREIYEYNEQGDICKIINELTGTVIKMIYMYVPERWATSTNIKPGTYLGPIHMTAYDKDGYVIESEDYTYLLLDDGCIECIGRRSIDDESCTWRVDIDGRLLYEKDFQGREDFYEYDHRGYLSKVIYKEADGTICHHEEHEYIYRDEGVENNSD